MKQILLISLILLLALNTSGQVQNVDSLTNVLTTSELPSKEQLELYKKITWFYTLNDLEKGFQYALEGLQLAKKSKDKEMVSVFNELLGRLYTSKSSYDTALVYYEKSLDIALDMKNEERVASIYMGMGGLFGMQDKDVEALDYFMKTLFIYEKTNHLEKLTVLANIGSIYRSLNNLDRAIYYLEQAQTIAEEQKDDFGKLNIYYNLGGIYVEKKDFEKAIAYELQTYNISRAIGYTLYEAASAQVLAWIYQIHKNDNEKAFMYANECLRLGEELGDKSMIMGAWNTISNIYRELNRYGECENAALNAWNTDSTSLNIGRNITYNIVYSNIYLGNKDKAAAFLIKNDSLGNLYNEKIFHEALADMEVKYQTQKKEIRIASLEKERQLYTWLAIVGVLLAVTLSIILWQKITNARREKQLVATRSVLDGEMKERARLAQDLHDRLSGNLSAVKIELNNNKESFQSIHDKLDSCMEEIRRAAHNLMPISLQFGLKTALEDFAAQFPNVRFHFFGEERHIDKRKAFIMYCCASELVNNSLRHSGAKNINMQLVQGDKHVSLTVQDDGSGFDEKAAMEGIGLKNIHDRIASCDGKIDIATSPGKGTEITIELKTGDV